MAKSDIAYGKKDSTTTLSVTNKITRNTYSTSIKTRPNGCLAKMNITAKNKKMHKAKKLSTKLSVKR